MAGNVGSDLSLDLLTEQLLGLIKEANIPEGSLGVATEGIGGSIYIPPYIYLYQESHTEVAYSWTPTVDSIVELVSTDACVIADNQDQYRVLNLAGKQVEIKAGVLTKFSVIGNVGQVTLKVHEQPN